MAMTQENRDGESRVYDGRIFDSPLVVPGYIENEPERYVAEKPYDLTRFEYSILRKPYTADFWFNIISGGTAGLVVSVIGKSITALIAQKQPTLENWEIVAILAGIIISLVLKYFIKSEDDKEKIKLMKVVDSHFEQNRPRHLHLTKGERK